MTHVQTTSTMNDLNRCYQECNPYPQSLNFNDTNDEITVIELSREIIGGPVQWTILKPCGVEIDALFRADAAHRDRVVLLQLLQVRLNNETQFRRGQLDISRVNFNRVVQEFDLHEMIEYGQSSVQVFGQISDGDGNMEWTSTAIHITDYFALFHRVDSGTRVMQGIYWAGQRVLPFLQNAIVQQRDLAEHPFYLNLCTAVAFEIAVATRLSETSELIAGVERRTGFKIWDLHRFKPSEGSYSALSAATSGYATSLAANKRLNKLTRCVLMSFDKIIAAQTSAMGRLKSHEAKLVASRIELLLQQNEIHLILIDLLDTRAQNQLTALFNLITQKDTQVTISLSKDSRTIASASKHDSTSMKTLAAVTVVFLPGTFISALFSTAFFDWNAQAGASVLNSRFWIYWVITIPLTVVTVATWLLWIKREELLHREQEVRAQKERKQHIEEEL